MIPVQSVTANFTKVVAPCIFLFSLFVLFTYLQVSSADEVVRTMINHMTNPDSQSHLPIKSGALIITCPFLFQLCAAVLYLNTICKCLFLNTGDSVVMCVNNLGALSSLEMAVITQAVIICLGNYGLTQFI